MSGSSTFQGGVGGVGPVGPAGPSGASGPGVGPMINGRFDCFDSGGGGGGGAPATLTEGGTMANGWVGQSDGGAEFYRNNGTDVGTSPNTQQRMEKTAAPGKLMAFVPFTNHDSVNIQGQTITAIFDFRAFDGGGDVPVRGALVRCNSGVEDSLPRPIVTAWNADGVDPTLDASYSVISGPLSFASGANYVTGALTAAVGGLAATDNIGLMFWTDEALDVGGELRLSDVSVQPGTATQRPNQPQQAVGECTCEEQVETTYADGQDPGTVTDAGALTMNGPGPQWIPYRQPKNFDPDNGPGDNPTNGVTFFSPTTGAAGNWRNDTAGADEPVNVVAGSSNEKGFSIEAPGAAPGDILRGHFLANGAL